MSTPTDPNPTDPKTPPVEPAAPGAPDDDGLGDKGKRALDAMKAERQAAKAEAAAEKKRADELAAKVAQYEDLERTDLERAQAAADAAKTQAVQATARAVRAEVRALAADQFADPTDATALLDLAKYTSVTGDIDTAAIQADLTALLEAKPHLKRPEQARGPRPDAGQGARPPAPPADFRTADDGTFASELAKYGLRPRS